MNSTLKESIQSGKNVRRSGRKDGNISVHYHATQHWRTLLEKRVLTLKSLRDRTQSDEFEG